MTEARGFQHVASSMGSKLRDSRRRWKMASSTGQPLPPVLSNAINTRYERVRADARDIDRTFIERGFARLGALIDRDEDFGGAGSYERFVFQLTHRDRVPEWSARSDAVHEHLRAFERRGEQRPAAYADEIVANDGLTASEKWGLLLRYYPQEWLRLRTHYAPVLNEASAREQRQLCTLYAGREDEFFGGGEQRFALRKEVYNAALADAFGAMGFSKRNRHKGVDVLFKPVSEHYAFVIETEVHCLEREAVRRGAFAPPDVEGTQHRLNWFPRVGAASGRNRRMVSALPIPLNSYACWHYKGFRDPPTLEVAVRAFALLFELTWAPLEAEFRAHD